jgi:hypothetical protein
VEEILGGPISEVFLDVKIRGIQGQGYYNLNYREHGTFINIATEGESAGQVMKA